MDHEGHGPGQCRPGCPVFDSLSVEERMAQMTTAEMLFGLIVRMEPVEEEVGSDEDSSY